MSYEPQESGWYTARLRSWDAADKPVVVRVALDAEGGVTTVWQIGSRDPLPLADWHLLSKVRIDGSTVDLELDRLQKEAWVDGKKDGLREAHDRQVEYDAARDRKMDHIFTADMFDTDFAEVGEATIAIHIRAGLAEDLSHGLSDLLCWARGYRAALGSENLDRDVMGIDWVRRVRETLTQAQRAADKAK